MKIQKFVIRMATIPLWAGGGVMSLRGRALATAAISLLQRMRLLHCVRNDKLQWFYNHAPKWLLRLSLAAFLAVTLGACASGEKIRKFPETTGEKPVTRGALKSVKPYTVNGVTYFPLSDAYGFEETGIASWYGPGFHGKRTANGEVYDQNGVTAAHKTLPLNTMVEVTRLDNNKKVVVRVNDRGPFVANRIIDLSLGAAKSVDVYGAGTAKVRIVALAEGQAPAEGGAPVPVGPLPNFNEGKFYVQVGAFGVPANAERARDKLDFAKDQIRLQPATTRDGVAVTRVQIGPFSKMTEAKEALAKATAQGYQGSFVVADN